MKKSFVKIISVVIAVMLAVTAMACMASAAVIEGCTCNCCKTCADAGNNGTIGGNRDIYLVLDVSGSMSDSISDLKNAVITFAEKMEEGEEVCVIAFDDRISYTSPFSGDPETVKSFADHLYSGGGTALFKSLVNHSSNLIKPDKKWNSSKK